MWDNKQKGLQVSRLNSSCEVKTYLNTTKARAKVTLPKRSSVTFASDFSKDSKTSMDRSAALFCYKIDAYQ